MRVISYPSQAGEVDLKVRTIFIEHKSRARALDDFRP